MKTTVTAGIFSSLFILPSIANAGIDPSLLKSLPVEGDSSGSAQRLRQVEAIQRPASDLTNIPFEELPSGVSYREYREGKGDAGTLILTYKKLKENSKCWTVLRTRFFLVFVLFPIL